MKEKISFEFNSISNKSDPKKIHELIKVTGPFNPLYYTVNTEIGNSNWTETFDTCLLIKGLTKTKLIPHIAINNKDECELNFIMEKYLSIDINNFFIIRGDKHVFNPSSNLNHGIDLIRYYKNSFSEAEIKSSIYPDFHKETLSPTDELFWIKEKAFLGVNEFICQFCLNSDAIQHLRTKLGKGVSVTPSLFPLVNFKFIERFTTENSIDYPLWINKIISKSPKASIAQLGMDITQFLIQAYLSSHHRLHFFTLNNADLVRKSFQFGS